jgi:phosphoglycerol transferase MdoB-like AlkP superfamily enzyme
MIKLAMAVVMLQVVLSRLVALPKILNNLGWMSLNEASIPILDQFVFWIMMSAMVSVTPIVLVPMIRVRRKLARRGMLEEAIIKPKKEGKLYVKLILFGIITLASYLLFFANSAAWTAFATQRTLIAALAIVAIAIYFSIVHGNFTHVLLDLFNIGALKAGVLEELERESAEKLAGAEVLAESEEG